MSTVEEKGDSFVLSFGEGEGGEGGFKKQPGKVINWSRAAFCNTAWIKKRIAEMK